MAFLSHHRGPLCWAAAILLLAIANAAGWVQDEAAQTLFIVLPIVAVMTMDRGQSCAVGPCTDGQRTDGRAA